MKEQTERGFTTEPAFTKGNLYGEGAIAKAFNCGPPRRNKPAPDWNNLIKWLKYLLEYRSKHSVALPKSQVPLRLKELFAPTTAALNIIRSQALAVPITYKRRYSGRLSEVHKFPKTSIIDESGDNDDSDSLNNHCLGQMSWEEWQAPSGSPSDPRAGTFDILIMDGSENAPMRSGPHPIWLKQLKHWVTWLNDQSTIFMVFDKHPGKVFKTIKDILGELEYEVVPTAYYVVHTKTRGRGVSQLRNCVTTVFIAQAASAPAWQPKLLTDVLKTRGADNYYLYAASPAHKVRLLHFRPMGRNSTFCI